MMKIAREVLSTFRGFSSGQAAILNGPLEAGHKCCSQAQRETPKKLHPRGPTALSVMLLLFLILLGMVYPHPTPTPTRIDRQLVSTQPSKDGKYWKYMSTTCCISYRNLVACRATFTAHKKYLQSKREVGISMLW